MDARIAANRFGLGAKPGEIRHIGDDARGWLTAQLVPVVTEPKFLGGEPSVGAVLREEAAARAEGPEAKKALKKELKARFRASAAARLAFAATTDDPFRERLVQFWSNHFAVSALKGPVVGVAASFERDAVRPYVCRHFGDLLLATFCHPAMLLYLDQASSMGPNSRAGLKRGKGLNENLAREILELHTLGVGNYDQGDVTAFAKILTGYTVDTDVESGFQFAPNRHEPGDKSFLGKTVISAGGDEAIRTLGGLAVHEATARHVSRKLAVHFLGDAPPEALVARMAATFMDSGGHLGQVAAVLVTSEEAWGGSARKLKTPLDLVVSAERLVGRKPDGAAMVDALGRLGQPWFAPPSPAGWPDDTASWSGPGAVLARVLWAESAGAQVGDERVDAEALGEQVLGAGLRSDTRAAMQQNPEEALAILIASPEFQWR